MYFFIGEISSAQGTWWATTPALIKYKCHTSSIAQWDSFSSSRASFVPVFSYLLENSVLSFDLEC